MKEELDLTKETIEILGKPYLVKDFLTKNQLFNTAVVENYFKNTYCFLCESACSNGLLLSDKVTFLCEKCFRRLETVHFPEIYQDALETYALQIVYFEEQLAYFDSIKPISAAEDITGAIAIVVIVGIFSPWFLLALIPIFLFDDHKRNREKEKEGIWRKSKEDFIAQNRPQKPQLRRFFDEDAILTEKDRKIVFIFEQWPGYPPFWTELKDKAIRQRGCKCAVLGCPSRSPIHLHHIKPIAEGGKHILDNLVLLCSFHHALEPSDGHEKIFAEVGEKWFSVVREHVRGDSMVRAHIRRKKNATISEIKAIARENHFHCEVCKSTELMFNLVDENNKTLKVYCARCDTGWVFKNGLLEEVGPELCNAFHLRAQLCEYNYVPRISIEDRAGILIEKKLNVSGRHKP
jgi:5-methylcytosine-specific restriction endonuclease McrA